MAVTLSSCLRLRKFVSTHILFPACRAHTPAEQPKSLQSLDKDPTGQTSLVEQPLSHETSLAWVQIHDEAPTSFGVNSWDGYHEMIPEKARLPYTKSTRFVNALDNCHIMTFSILYRRSMLDTPIKLAGVNLPGIRIAKEGVTKMKATMSIQKSLVGSFNVYDMYTKNTASVEFDGRPAFQASQARGLLSKNN